ncbi:MAG: S1 RNA-binding domain-containing protein, partial [Bacteroidales bacterium]
ELQNQLNLNKYISDKIGMPTLKDIKQELEKPGRDPRQTAQIFEFDPNVKTLSDLHEGMILPGIVNNITNFGCFVDIGIKENGLIHLSNMAKRFIKDPTEVVKLHQHVEVKVIGIDKERKRIQLSLILD